MALVVFIVIIGLSLVLLVLITSGRSQSRAPTARSQAPPAPIQTTMSRTATPTALPDIGSWPPSGYGRRRGGHADKIEQAQSRGADLVFQYCDKDGRVTHRRVTPIRFVDYPHQFDEEETRCLEAYCHLRRANRSFALKRMSNITVVEAKARHDERL